MQVRDLLLRQKENDKMAIWHNGKSLTYAQWYKLSELVADRLNNEINGDSEKIGIFLPNSIEYAISYFSILNINKIIIPIGIQAKEREIVGTMKYCEIDLFISNSQYCGMFESVQEICDFCFKVYYIDSEECVIYGGHKELLGKTELVNTDATNIGDEVVIMLHTSGTTSHPKRVMLTNKNLLSNVDSNVTSLKLTEQDRVCIALPMFFGYCNTAQFLSHIYVGGSIYIMGSIFIVHDFFNMIQKYKITNFTAVPTMLLLLLEYKYGYKYDYSSLKFICFGGGVMSKELLRELIRKYESISFIHTYGQTECSPRLTALLPPFTLSKLGSVGKAIPNVTISVVDEDGRAQEAYKEGEIIAKGDNLMRGYYKRPEATEEIIRNGWLHTGDIGYFDDEEFLYISGRKKNMVIVGGQNVYPEEVEEIIREFQGVKDVYVYGIADELMGEVLAAQVVIEEEGRITDLKEYCKLTLPKYKNPVKFETVKRLEKTYNGKARRDKK